MKDVIEIKFEFEREAFEEDLLITDEQWRSLEELSEQESFDDSWAPFWDFFRKKLAEIKEGE
jgi:hypothetical protein